jgi:diacylglycerol kinase family enzyme
LHLKYFDVDEALKRPRVLDAADFVIAAGGDGTIRKVALKLLGRGPALAPLPLGTANNIAHSLGLSDEPERIVEGWMKPRRRKFDVGVARGSWGVRRFVEGIGIGLISRTITVLRDIDEVSVHEWKKMKHKLHRDACVAAALAHEMPALRAKLTIDGHDRSDDFVLVEILNIRRAGPAVELARDADFSDGKFDVVTVTAAQRSRLMNALKRRLADETPRGLTTRRAKSVQLTPAIDCDLRIDDRNVAVAARERVDVTLERGALELVLPE